MSDVKRLKALEAENAKLKRLWADAMLDNTVLKDLLGKKNGDARRQPGRGRPCRRDPRRERAAGVRQSRGADRSSVRCRSLRPDDAALRARLRQLADQRRRVGDRGLHVLLRLGAHAP